MAATRPPRRVRRRRRGRDEADRSRRNTIAGVAVGVGSAAIVAALLYANRSRDHHGPHASSHGEATTKA
jgi:hypothetical protein